MTREEFIQFSNQYLYLDGATGSNLVRAGMPSGVCPEQWILEHSDVMLALQKEYVKAGTDILYAPTFTANRIKLGEYGLENRMEQMIEDLVAISREAAASAKDRVVYVAGDLTMTGEQLRPMGNMELEILIDIYKEQIKALEKAGVDLLVVETMMSLAEARAALIAAKETCELPVMVTMTFEEDGRTLYGTDARTAAVVLESLGACAVGVNCSAGPARMREIVEEMTAVTASVPIIAKPNAGLPFLDEQGRTSYSMSADEFIQEMSQLTDAGATILGGCCGTTPEFIRGLKEAFGRQITVRPERRNPNTRVLTSERKTLSFGLDGSFFIVGERINPTGKKLFQAQLREGVMDKVLQFAEEQEQCGAQVLDINMGMSGIDEKEMMLRAIEEVSGVTNLPLSLDSSHVEVLEAALRHYPGRALINSISLETEKYEKLIPIAKKYGAMFILLPLCDKGLPENLEEKKEIIEKVLNRAYACGLRKDDIVVDGLVATVGANRRAGLETLETIRYCREKELATICGLSNISFGMPERSYVNAAFLTLAIREGLTMAIANPSQELLVSCALATDLLLAKEDADIHYIEYANVVAMNRKQREASQSISGIKTECGTNDTENFGGEAVMSAHATVLSHAVLKGNRNGIAALTKEALEAGEEPQSLLNDVLMPAINQVGELFDKGKYFLPQLIASAEAMKNAIQVLEPLLMKDADSQNMPVIIIATVEGDIHDIGKNLVALMLRNYGFRVIDLGKDVPGEEIIRAAKENNAQIIALSALMTTTMQRMREVIALVRKEKLPTKVMIGGAVITQDYADEIGADGYSRDAAEAVKIAQKLTS
ncbi:MAG: homocysteine S-methyltransferase family protein [Acetatifactor sp.]|nr:homocysteine S-methyltransferase family protein [Acetatifactor sp.]